MSPGPQESLLRSVLRSTGLAQDGQRESVHPPLEPPYERSRSIGIARSEPGQQCFVRGFHTTYYGSKRVRGLDQPAGNPSAPPTP